MSAFHQMGHDSSNLLGVVAGFQGAILSPVNLGESAIIALTEQHREALDFVFDPQLYFPRRSDKGVLGTWSYFPQDFDTADMSSPAWWDATLTELVEAASRVGATAVCSPATLAGSTATNDYYETMRTNAERLAALTAKRDLVVLQTVPVRLADLATPDRVFEIASIVSNTRTVHGIYLILLAEGRPRDELRDVDELKGAMKLIRLLEDADIRVIVACSSSDVLLWKTAGASASATGKFANLRRFSEGRFNEQEDGGRLMAYWFEESLLAFVRESDIARLQALGLAQPGTNPWSAQILEQLQSSPGKPWVALGWRQYMHWFADVENRLSTGSATARDLIRAAERNWQLLEDRNVFLEEPRNDGSWLRPWLRAVVEYENFGA